MSNPIPVPQSSNLFNQNIPPLPSSTNPFPAFNNIELRSSAIPIIPDLEHPSDTESSDIENHSSDIDVVDLSKSICLHTCSLCETNCTISSDHDVHLCNNTHLCKNLCELPGNCDYNNKSQCIAEIPQGQSTHNGIHQCNSNFHSCEHRCPECGSFCQKPYRHNCPHEASIHSTNKEKVTCNEKCAQEHQHFIQCKGGNLCAERKYPNNAKHLEDSENLDEISCKYFWISFGWEELAN